MLRLGRSLSAARGQYALAHEARSAGRGEINRQLIEWRGAPGWGRTVGGQRGFASPARLVGRCGKHLELRNIVVPFDERWDAAEALHRVLVERPHLGANRMVVSVEQIAAVVAMACKMELYHAASGDGVDV